jgi:hypothetical protein
MPGAEEVGAVHSAALESTLLSRFRFMHRVHLVFNQCSDQCFQEPADSHYMRPCDMYCTEHRRGADVYSLDVQRQWVLILHMRLLETVCQSMGPKRHTTNLDASWMTEKESQALQQPSAPPPWAT